MIGITSAIFGKQPPTASGSNIKRKPDYEQKPVLLHKSLERDEILFEGRRRKKPVDTNKPTASGSDPTYYPPSSDSEGSENGDTDPTPSQNPFSAPKSADNRPRHPYNLRKRQKPGAGNQSQAAGPGDDKTSTPPPKNENTKPPDNEGITPQEREEMDKAVMGFLMAMLGQGNQPLEAVDPDSEDESGPAGIKVVSYKKSPFGPKAERLGFKRIAGMEPLKTDLNRLLVDQLKNPQLYKDYGLENSASGVLLYGPPGNGKTYFAKAVAEEAGANFLEIHPSTIASPFIHQTSKFISEAFDAAASAAKRTKHPTVLLIDEVDAVAPQRVGDSSNTHNNEEVAEFLNQLNECANKNVFVVATTNLPEQLDPALIRSGRMNAKIYVGGPDEKSREQVLQQYLNQRAKVVDEKLDVSALASKTQGYSIADLKELVNQAARHALERRGKITEGDFKLAMKKVMPSVNESTAETYKQMMGKFETKPSSEAWRSMYI